MSFSTDKRQGRRVYHVDPSQWNSTSLKWNSTSPKWNSTYPKWNSTSPKWISTYPKWNSTSSQSDRHTSRLHNSVWIHFGNISFHFGYVEFHSEVDFHLAEVDFHFASENLAGSFALTAPATNIEAHVFWNRHTWKWLRYRNLTARTCFGRTFQQNLAISCAIYSYAYNMWYSECSQMSRCYSCMYISYILIQYSCTARSPSTT